VTPATNHVGEFTESGQVVSRIKRDAIFERESLTSDRSGGYLVQLVVV
jgi:hypothetical protein